MNFKKIRWTRRQVAILGLSYWALVLVLAYYLPYWRMAAYEKSRLHVTAWLSGDPSEIWAMPLKYVVDRDTFSTIVRGFNPIENPSFTLLVDPANHEHVECASGLNWIDFAGMPLFICFTAAYAVFRVFRIAIEPYDPNPVILWGASDLHDDQEWVP